MQAGSMVLLQEQGRNKKKGGQKGEGGIKELQKISGREIKGRKIKGRKIDRRFWYYAGFAARLTGGLLYDCQQSVLE